MEFKSSVSALVLGGGDGVRMGGQVKAFLEVDGVTLLERSVNQMLKFSNQVLVGLPSDQLDRGKALVGESALVVAGGPTRQETFENLLKHADREFVMVHDVARPLTSDSLVEAVIRSALEYGSGCPVVRHIGRDSLALEVDGSLGIPVDRDRLVAIQTPYAFRRDLLLNAIDQARNDDVTENSLTTLVTRIGGQVRTIEGDESNLKVTFPSDWDHVKGKLTNGSA